MSCHFPVIKPFDRLAIAEVKWARTQSNQEELKWYQKQTAQFDLDNIKIYYEEFKNMQVTKWALATELKSGREAQLNIEISRRVILLINYNNKINFIKNTLVEVLNCFVREIKQDHLSA